jgi:hypothetical protein
VSKRLLNVAEKVFLEWFLFVSLLSNKKLQSFCIGREMGFSNLIVYAFVNNGLQS